MDDNKKSGIGKIAGTILSWAAVLYLMTWLFGWLLGRRWGLFLILWLLWFIGAMIILGGALTVITGDAGLADRGWPWLLFGIAAAVMTVVQIKMCER
jgi:hypothetical protein